MKRLIATVIMFTLVMGNLTISLALPNEDQINQDLT